MSEIHKLNEAQRLISLNQKRRASRLFQELYKSKDPMIKLGASMGLIVIIDPVTQNEKLLKIIEEATNIATTMNRNEERGYLLSRKIVVLATKNSFLVDRQKRLKLAANVFDWINFSLGRDEAEYDLISTQRKQLEKAIYNLEIEVINLVDSDISHYLCGHIYVALGQYYGSQFLTSQYNWMATGSMRSWLANIYFIRRWNLYKFILFNKDGRRKINESKNKCVYFFERAIAEFETDKNEVDLAHALYNFVVQLASMNSFVKAKNCLSRAKLLAEAKGETLLLSKIIAFEAQLEDKNRHIRNYVEELGLE